MTEGSALVLRGDALHIPLPDNSVDLIITSPPYFALRSYRDEGEHYAGQIGSEETPQAFLEALWAATREMMRVLKPTGSMFINLGDKYAGSGGHNNASVSRWHTAPLEGGTRTLAENDAQVNEQIAKRRNAPDRYNQNRTVSTGPRMSAKSTLEGGKRGEVPTSPYQTAVPTKSLMGLPWRYAIGCIDDLGLILRAEIVWSKPNCLSGGNYVYARIKDRPVSIRVHDLCRHYRPEDVHLYGTNGWTQVLWWQETGRHPDSERSYNAVRAARKRGEDVHLTADLELELRDGQRIGCTREHRWPTTMGILASEDLEVGDVLKTERLPDEGSYGDVLPEAPVGWFVGLYIAEGSHSEKTIQISGHTKELERFKRLEELAEAFHGTCSVYAYGNKASINLSGAILHGILDTYVAGRTAKDKHLSPKCWERGDVFLEAVLEGYLDGDGHYETKSDRWVLGFTNNDYLAQDLRTLAARLGWSLRLRRVTHTGFGKEWPGWGGNLVSDPARRQRPDSEIVAIRQSRARQFWDIGVADEPHLFALASGVLTHNSLPESVTDRVRRSHEQWFHFTKELKYFAAVDEIREASQDSNLSRKRAIESWDGEEAVRDSKRYDARPNEMKHRGVPGVGTTFMNSSLGKLPGSVWTIPSEPLIVPQWAKDKYNLPDHFAAFPQEWPRRLILGWSPSGVCVECGEGRRPVVNRKPSDWEARKAAGEVMRHGDHNGPAAVGAGGFQSYEATITGYACTCPERGDGYPGTAFLRPATKPAVILDPFGGTGTVAMVARALGRDAISLDLSMDYSRLAQWRIHTSGHGAKALGKTWKERQGDLL